MKSRGEGGEILPVRIISSPEVLKVISSPIGWKILNEFKKPSCPMDIAKKLNLHEQKVYYYVTKLKKEKLIEEVGREQRHGTLAKFYMVTDGAYSLVVNKSQFKRTGVFKPPYGFEPFVKNGKLNARIVVGSPDPHGPFRARASDSCCAIDFALFLGSLSGNINIPNYKLDVELRDKDLKGNIISIGGPTVNMITRRLNERLPIYFNMEKDIHVCSRLSGKVYTEDEIGIITITDNPFDKQGKVLVIAGKRFQGTRAAVLGFISSFEKIMEGNRFDRNVVAKVIRGYDMDSDGVVDRVEILE
jgi:hypothetical protein